jgi:hypothetical protein
LKTLEAEGRPFGLRVVCCVLTVQVKAEGVVCKKFILAQRDWSGLYAQPLRGNLYNA